MEGIFYMLGGGFLLELSEQRVWCKIKGIILAEAFFCALFPSLSWNRNPVTFDPLDKLSNP